MRKTELVDITVPYSGYIAPLKMMGPVVHPLNVEIGKVKQILLSGAKVFKHDRVTKVSTEMTLASLNQEAVAPKVAEQPPVNPVQKSGVPVTPQFTYNEDGTIDESTINWTGLSKNAKKALRNKIDIHNQSVRESAVEAETGDSPNEADFIPEGTSVEEVVGTTGE